MAGLSPAQVDEYWQRGFLHVPALLDPGEVKLLQDECERLVRAGEGDTPALPESFPREDAVGRSVRNLLDPVLVHSRVIRELLSKRELRAALHDVFRDEALLFKDKLIVRPPGTAGYGLHQDFAYYGWTGVPADRLLALQISVDPADEDNGAVWFHSGRHGSLLPATERDGNDIRADLLGPGRGELVATRPGDAVLFHSLTPHWSDVNRSDGPRRTLYLTYNAAASGDLYRVYYQERGAIL